MTMLLPLTCVVCKSSCPVVNYARVGVNEEEINGIIAQAELEVSFTVPPPVLLPQEDIQLQGQPPNPSETRVNTQFSIAAGPGCAVAYSTCKSLRMTRLRGKGSNQ